jgi:DnaJ-class molecular chaperone
MSKDLYEVLGVSRNADTSEIRKAYKELSKIHHPDKGGDPEKFKEIAQAHEILSDDNKRQMYDMTGSTEEGGGGMPGGMPFGMGGGGGMADFLGQMFGGGMPFMPGMPGMPGMGGGRAPRRDGKAPSKQQELPLKLADFYHGRGLSVKLGRQANCKKCQGSGGESFETCSPCGGEGHMNQVVNMGPIQMVNRGTCPVCRGKGKQPVGKCSDCEGKGANHEEKNLEIKIEPGMMPGNTIVFPGMCSDHPGWTEPGDVVVMLREADEEGQSASWVREGNRLKTSITINLTEALLGTTKILQGHPGYPAGVPIEIPAGVQNLWTGTIPSLGMPVRGTPKFGEALVTIMVVPSQEETSALKKQSVLLKSVMPSQPEVPSHSETPRIGRWGML